MRATADPGADVPVQRADWPPVVQQEGRKTALTRAAPEAAAGTGWAGRYREPPGSPAKPASAAGRRPGAAGPATPPPPGEYGDGARCAGGPPAGPIAKHPAASPRPPSGGRPWRTPPGARRSTPSARRRRAG